MKLAIVTRYEIPDCFLLPSALEVKGSTARFYRDTFPGFFSSVGEGRKRQYHPALPLIEFFLFVYKMRDLHFHLP